MVQTPIHGEGDRGVRALQSGSTDHQKTILETGPKAGFGGDVENQIVEGI